MSSRLIEGNSVFTNAFHCEHSARSESSCPGKTNCYIAIVHLLERDHKVILSKDTFTNATVGHIVPVVRKKGAFVAAAVLDIVSLGISVNSNDSSFVCKLPNRFEKRLIDKPTRYVVPVIPICW